MTATAEIGVFHGLTAPKLYVPHQNLRTKGTSLGCQLASKMIPITRNCAVWVAPRSQTCHRRQ